MPDVIDRLIKREGDGKITDDPKDSGGRTIWGISEKAHPELWRNGPPTREQARAFYERLLERFAAIPDPHLREQMFDIAVTSGPHIPVMKLQQVLGVEIDGILGPQTLGALARYAPKAINNKLVVARVLGMVRIAQKRPKDLKFLFGWVSRAFGFMQ